MISADLLSLASLQIGWLIYGAALAWALIRTPWVELFSDTRRQHLLFGTILALLVLWLIRRDFSSGLSFHFLGMTAATLLLDWPTAIIAAFLTQLSLTALGYTSSAAIGLNGCLFVCIPIVVTEICAKLVEKTQPKNLFVYIFFSGFFPSALATLISITAALGILLSDGIYPIPNQMNDIAAYLLLVIFPEAFINGTAITALVVFYPDWLETFNRTRYLSAPWK